jgi:hypothetical protein
MILFDTWVCKMDRLYGDGVIHILRFAGVVWHVGV